MITPELLTAWGAWGGPPELPMTPTQAAHVLWVAGAGGPALEPDKFTGRLIDAMFAADVRNLNLLAGIRDYRGLAFAVDAFDGPRGEQVLADIARMRPHASTPPGT